MILHNYDNAEHWQSQVYKPCTFGLPDNWETIKQRVVWRDFEQCQMCECGYDLSVHHIKPRDEGGGHDMPNLITLCNHCHDIVEMEGLRSVSLIRNWYDDPVTDNRPVGLTWQSWVYGGARRPAA